MAMHLHNFIETRILASVMYYTQLCAQYAFSLLCLCYAPCALLLNNSQRLFNILVSVYNLVYVYKQVQVCCHTHTYVRMCMIRQACLVSSYLCACAHTTSTSVVLTRENEIACNYVITAYLVYL